MQPPDTGCSALNTVKRTPHSEQLLDAVKIQPLPQVVLRLDQLGHVIDFENALIGRSFYALVLRRGWSAHRCLHPDCAQPDCQLLHSIDGAMAGVDAERILEWELTDASTGFMTRLHLRRAQSGAKTWATLTVTDITEGRRATGTLREANRSLSELIDRTENVRVREVKRLDRKLRNLSAELIIAQETERRRIAAELHDGLGQWLSMAKLSLESGLCKVADGAAAVDLNRAFSHLKTAIREVRSIARNLRPSMLEEFGLVPTLELLCHELQLSRPKMEVLCRIDGDPTALGQAHCVAMVRILQEALHNVAKHSGATSIKVDARFQPTQSLLRIRDNGRGIAGAVNGKLRVGGMGVASMRERAGQSGGVFRLASAVDVGTQVSVSWRHSTGGPEIDQDSGTYKTIGDSIGRDGRGTAQS
jgi:signal transduction histidine kinase